ncbi:MAG: oxidoreductase, partial [Halanaeroarchaeum sp.]
GPVQTQFDERARDEIGTLDPTGAYESLYDVYDDYTAISGLGAVEPEEVAEVILEAGVSPDPDPRYAVGPVAAYSTLARFIPDRWRDTLFAFLQRLP